MPKKILQRLKDRFDEREWKSFGNIEVTQDERNWFVITKYVKMTSEKFAILTLSVTLYDENQDEKSDAGEKLVVDRSDCSLDILKHLMRSVDGRDYWETETVKRRVSMPESDGFVALTTAKEHLQEYFAEGASLR